MDVTSNMQGQSAIPVPTVDEVTPAPAPVRRRNASPFITQTADKRRFRLSFATLINLGALIVLFTVVFVLQHLSSTVREHRNESATARTQATEEAAGTGQQNAPVDAASSDSAAGGAVVDLTELAPTPAKKKAASKSSAAQRTPSSRPTAQKAGIGWEDRQRSADLVEHLDGSYRRSSATNYGTPAPQSYAATSSSYSSRAAYSTASTQTQPAPRRSDLDDESARQHYLSANRQTTTTPYPSPVSQTAPVEETVYERTAYTPTTASRKPAWEVTAVQR